MITRVKPGEDQDTDIAELRATVSNQLEIELQAWANQYLNQDDDTQQIEQQR